MLASLRSLISSFVLYVANKKLFDFSTKYKVKCKLFVCLHCNFRVFVFFSDAAHETSYYRSKTPQRLLSGVRAR